MRVVNLTNSFDFVLVDDTHFERIQSLNTNWFICGSGLIQSTRRLGKRSIRTGLKRYLFLHKFILEIEDSEVDHIDNNRLNCQEYNLRKASSTQNSSNQFKRAGGLSKFKGVSWDKNNNQWMVRVRSNGVTYFGGRFDDEILAAKKANELIIFHHKEFAKPNQIGDLLQQEVNK